MKRSPMNPRTSRMARTKMKKRPKPKAVMLRTHGTEEFRAWMKRQPCIVCGRTPSDAAHLKSGGVGRKDDVTRTVPLCSDYPDQGCLALGHHSLYDAGKQSFRAEHAGIDFEDAAAETQARWLAGRGDAGQMSTCDPNFWPEVVE